ncbi:FecR family protein [Sphingobacterium suaedae]|uniref:FecR family protein n=1 Tax=Sphingobacterium suaedae TaxID=1686402 RepID=A0ABW5KH02_9SPHI
MKRSIFNFLIDRYKQGVATDNERKLFDSWYGQFDKQEVSPKTKIDSDRREEALRRTLEGLPTAPHVRTALFPMRRWLRVAGFFLIVGIGAFIWSLNQRDAKQSATEIANHFRVFTTAVGERKQIVLPDGSVVTLNARSTMQLDEGQYGRTTRTVQLVEGEAFFQVTSDSSRAFIVETGPLQTRVLGTSFNIQAYAEMAEQVISVFTGRVQVKRGTHLLGILHEGDRIRFEKAQANSATERFSVNDEQGWMTGRVSLRQASFEELALAVKNNYGITLKASDKRIANQRYSLPIQENVPLEHVVSAICAIHQNKSRKEGDTVLIY